jgi:hypothetical protein
MPEDAPQHPSDASPQAKVPPRQEEVGEVHLMYTIVGPQDSVPVFELSRTLEALGNVIEEGDHVLYPDRHQLVVKVRPFQEGSFLMDLVLSLQHNPTVLFFLTQPEAIARIEQVLEHLGLIKKAGEAIKTVLEVIEFLRNGRARRIEPTGPETFNYYNEQGQVMPVSQPIHNLVNNGTIQQYFYPAVGAPLQRGAC